MKIKGRFTKWPAFQPGSSSNLRCFSPLRAKLISLLAFLGPHFAAKTPQGVDGAPGVEFGPWYLGAEEMLKVQIDPAICMKTKASWNSVGIDPEIL